ncbi:hypothetical protein TWF730_004405 [Orbilia blumenaviensis]|uniref:F-box domain-containing protein n=1 Tax=Orbilia blumenaviensis TaxID=1796055 RepID=A0AAV9TYN2_9PEZI
MAEKFIPLEIQYHVLSFACQDWREQAVLQQVCRAWRTYIAKSRDAFVARYVELPISEQQTAPIMKVSLKQRPDLHNVTSCQHGFVCKPASASSSSPTKIVPCNFEIDVDSGNIIGVTRPAISAFSAILRDPTILPADQVITAGRVESATTSGRDSVTISVYFHNGGSGYQRAFTRWKYTDNGRVGTYLREISRGFQDIFSIKYEVLYSCGCLDIWDPTYASEQDDAVSRGTNSVGLKYFNVRIGVFHNNPVDTSGHTASSCFIEITPVCLCRVGKRLTVEDILAG